MGVENNIPEGWIETSLNEVCDVKGGKRLPKGETLVSKKNKHPYIRITDFAGNSINKSKLQFVPNDTFEKISRYIVNENDIIISIVGTIGLVAKIDKELDNANLTENCNKLVNLRGVNNDFIYYYLTSRIGQFEINKNTVGAVQKKLPIYGVQSIKINLPPLQEQKAIAKVLTAFDEKIELLQAQNKTLETMAQNIFKEWFGKYQIGDDLPEGWRVGEFGELFNLTMGLSPKGDSYNHDMNGVPLLNGAGDYTGEKLDPKRYTSKPTRINKVGDLVFCIRGTIGKIVFAEKEYCLGRGVAALSPKESNDKYFNYIKLKRIIDELTRNATGSVILGLSKDDIKKAELILPSRKKLDEFSKVVKPLFNKIEINNNQLQSLTKTRDSLLPKLMSGQVRVKM